MYSQYNTSPRTEQAAFQFYCGFLSGKNRCLCVSVKPHDDFVIFHSSGRDESIEVKCFFRLGVFFLGDLIRILCVPLFLLVTDKYIVDRALK